jgi:hypothetical protein
MGKYTLSASFEHFWQVHVEAWHSHLHARGITPDTAGIASSDDPDHDAGAPVVEPRKRVVAEA